METAVLGGGCFWCLDAVYRQLDGVKEVTCGYAAGTTSSPTYEQVCSGTTGHAEVVRVTYHPGGISYKDLLRVFFSIHDPTTKDRQGNDVGTQYRSIIVAQDRNQRRIAEDVMRQVTEERLYPGPLVTQLVDAVPFYPAEEYHQDYFANNPSQGYCQAVVAPKVAKFRRKWAHRLKE